MKICVYGAGAIGGWVGAKLATAGSNVSFIARGQTLEVLSWDGIRLQSRGSCLQAAVRVSSKAAELGEQDLVIVAVKATSMRDVAREIGPLLGESTVVVTAMNGVPWWFFNGLGGRYEGIALETIDPDGEITNAIPVTHVIGCVVHASCSLDSPGVVRHHFGNKLILGELTGEVTARLDEIVALLRVAGFDAERSSRIQQDVWFKLWGNMTVNPISAVSGATADEVLEDDLVREFMSRVMYEAKEIGARVGLPIEQAPEDRHEVTSRLGAFKPSMLQDVIAGKQVELDAMVGAVREMGRITGVSTPFTNALFGLARLTFKQRGLYARP